MMRLQQPIPIAAAAAVGRRRWRNYCINPQLLVLIPPPPPPPSGRGSGSGSGSKCKSNTLGVVVSRRHHLLSALGNGNGYTFDDGDGDGEKEEKEEKEEEEEEIAKAKGKAIDAVYEILHQHVGLSSEESLFIASNSPNYIQMLLDDTFFDSDDLDLDFDLKKKVFDMALEKDAKGFIPFLESLGLSLPTSMFLARSHHLSSHTLPLLLPQVKYVKDIFFSSAADADDGLAVIAQKATHMMMHLSVPTDDHLQLSLSFFEKIQATHGGLDFLASADVSFRFLIESFPHLLSLPMESRAKPMLTFLEDSGVPKRCMTTVLLLFPSIIFYDIEKDVKPRLQAFTKVNAVDKDFGKMLVKYPWIVSTSIQKNYLEVLSYFHKEKVPEDSIQRAIKRWPPLLGCSVSKLRLMVERFRELGVNNKRLGQIIATSPQLLMRKPREFRQVVSCLQDLGLDDEAIGRILGRCPKIFAANLERTLKKKVGFLIDLGVSRTRLPRVIRKYPELLILDIDKAMLPRIKYLTKMGLSTRNVVSMVERFSPLLGYSVEEVLRPKIEFLVKTMGKPLIEVVAYPRYFSYCLEKKIKRRYWVVKSKDVDCSLQEMLGKNDEEFAAEYL